jgi:hypothetical protein
VPDCEWCHTPITDQAQQIIGVVSDRLDDRRLDIVRSELGQVPRYICPHDFIILLGHVNEVVFAEAQSSA